MKGVAGALDQYKLDNGHFPTMQEGGLDALINQPATAKNWMPGGYVKGGYPKDSWKMISNMSYLEKTTILLIYIHLAQMVKKVVKVTMPIFIISLN